MYSSTSSIAVQYTQTDRQSDARDRPGLLKVGGPSTAYSGQTSIISGTAQATTTMLKGSPIRQ